MLKIILWQLLAVVALTLISSSNWLISANIKAGTAVLVTSTYSTPSGVFTVNYPSGFAVATVRTVTGIINFEQASPAGLNLGISCTITSATNVRFQYTLVLFDGTTINSLKTNYFSYDYSVHTYITSNTNTATYASGDQVYSGTGYRQTTAIIIFTTPIDVTHSVKICPFIYVIRLNRASTSDDFVARVKLEVVDSTSYTRTYSTDSTCRILQSAQYRLNFDQTALQAAQTTYLDVTFFTGTDGVAAPFHLIYSDPTNFIAGFNHIAFSGTGPAPQFSFDPATFTLTSPGYLALNITTVNYRVRNCLSPTTPYYFESQNVCTDICPNPYFAEPTYKYCASCTAGCASCTNSTQCTSCQLRQYRIASPSPLCSCLPGFYENAAKQCVQCPTSRACDTCGVVSGSANPGGIDCLSCSCAHHRTKSGGNCICDPGYTADLVTNGPYCVKT